MAEPIDANEKAIREQAAHARNTLVVAGDSLHALVHLLDGDPRTNLREDLYDNLVRFTGLVSVLHGIATGGPGFQGEWIRPDW